MEEGKKQGASASSLTSELFGTKEVPASSSSSGFFASIFPQPSTKGGKNSPSSGVASWQKLPSNNQAWQGKQTAIENYDNARNSTYDKNQSSIFQEHRVEPCHYSSSLYYGGQDIYSSSPSTQNSESHPIYKKDGVEDDHNGNYSDSACRGNWWQGSLYY